MNKLIKASLIATAFLFAAGCSTQTKPSTHVDTVSNAHQQVAKNVHPEQKCKGKKCKVKADKLGETSYKADTAK